MVSTESIRRSVLWLWLAVSAFAAIEPSPYEFMFALAALAFFPGAVMLDRSMVPMIISMAFYNAAGFIALTPFVNITTSVTFTFITFYISLTMLLFAGIVAARPLERMAAIRSGYVFAAVVAAILGILGYFNVGHLGPYFTLYDNTRASGPFKDPNVFGPFLVPPIVWLCQDILLRRGGLVGTVLKLAPLLIAVLLSFSRGAVIDCLASLLMLIGLTFLTANTSALQRRTLMVAVGGAVLVLAIVVVALSIPSVRELAMQRATLTEDYDSGETGRFGNQLRAIPLLLDRPFGFGPLLFSTYFPQDPHEVFLSAFASFGWVGGLAFASFIAVTIYFGWALTFRRWSLQPQAVALWSACFPQILQGVQIDTSHWRHLFMMCGCIFGLAAAARQEIAARARQSSAKTMSAPIASAASITIAPPRRA